VGSVRTSQGISGVSASGAVDSVEVAERVLALTGVAAAGSVGEIIAVYWKPIDDNQDPNWQNINDAQSPGWAQVGTTQSPDWQQIAA
jgi:hypothetical protein